MHLPKSLTILSFCTATFLAGCTKTDNPSVAPLHQTYEVQYSLTDSTTYLFANFREYTVNGPYIHIFKDSIIKVNNLTSNHSDYRGQYTKGWNIAGIQDLNIEFLKGGTFIRNSVSVSDVGEFDFGAGIPDTISRANDLTITWVGDPLRDMENISVSIQTISTNTYSYSSYTKSINEMTTTFASNELTSYKSEKLGITLSRKIVLPLTQLDGTASGEKIVEKIRYKEVYLTD